MAIGADDGEVNIDVSAETDMSSILPQNATLKENLSKFRGSKNRTRQSSPAG